MGGKGIETDFGFVGPLIAEFVQHVDVAEGGENPAHETRFTHCFLDRVETRADHALGADHARDRRRHLAEEVVRSSDGFLARLHGMGELLRGFEAGIHDRDRDHPDAVLHALREHCDFGEQALIGGTGHDLVLIPFTAAVGSHDHHCWTQVFHEMPACACDGEDVGVGADVAEDFEGGVVLEEEVHVNSYATNVLEHVAELHVFWIRAKSIKSGRGEMSVRS